MTELRIRTARPQRLSPADLMREMSDAALALAGRMDAPARHHHEIEHRVAEGERIASAIRALVRGRC